jgi:hypothetical protein
MVSALHIYNVLRIDHFNGVSGVIPKPGAASIGKLLPTGRGTFVGSEVS